MPTGKTVARPLPVMMSTSSTMRTTSAASSTKPAGERERQISSKMSSEPPPPDRAADRWINRWTVAVNASAVTFEDQPFPMTLPITPPTGQSLSSA